MSTIKGALIRWLGGIERRVYKEDMDTVRELLYEEREDRLKAEFTSSDYEKEIKELRRDREISKNFHKVQLDSLYEKLGMVEWINKETQDCDIQNVRQALDEAYAINQRMKQRNVAACNKFDNERIRLQQRVTKSSREIERLRYDISEMIRMSFLHTDKLVEEGFMSSYDARLFQERLVIQHYEIEKRYQVND